MKVLYFDYWTKGIHNFTRIDAEIKNRGFSSRLLHIGSWRDKSIVTEEEIDGLQCRDIRYYGGNIGYALKREAPDVLIVLNYTHTMDRVVRRYCRLLDIKCVYMMHGARSTSNAAIKKFSRNLNKSIGFLGIIKRLPAYLRTMKYYWQAGRFQDTKIQYFKNELYYFYQMMFRPGEATLKPRPHPDLWWDRALVYSQRYQDFLVNEISFSNEAVIIVGNPELDNVIALKVKGDSINAEKYFKSAGIKLNFTSERVLTYIENANVEMGIMSEGKRIDIIRKIAEAANRNQYDLVIKLHPNTIADSIAAAFLAHKNVHLIQKTDIARLINNSTAVIGRASTALLIPVILEKPIFYEFGEELIKENNYRRILRFVQDNDIDTVLKDPYGTYFTSSQTKMIQDFIATDIGPISGSTIERIGDEIEQLCTEQSTLQLS